MSDTQSTDVRELEAEERKFARCLEASPPLTDEEAALFYRTHTPLDLPIFVIGGLRRREKQKADR